jgi:putative transposase
VIDWPHAPLHRFTANAHYFVTAGTYQKQHFYRDAASLERLQQRLFDMTRKHAFVLQAWALFSNHYHFVAYSDGAGEQLAPMLRELHSREAIDCNRRDEASGRRVWYQYRETLLTFERSWLARLRYTHQNPVHHKLVDSAVAYRWCSASWFERTASPAFANTVAQFRTDRVKVDDDFEVAPPQ